MKPASPQPTAAPAPAPVPAAPAAPLDPNAALMQTVRDGIKNAIIKNEFDIPMLPTVATEVMKLTNNPNVGLSDLEKVVKQDQALAARVIKTANSPFYRGVAEITSLSNAMSRIGLKSIKDIVVSLSVQSQTFKLAGFEPIMDRIWDHSVACAGVAQHYAQKIGAEADAAFLAGLLHDVGKTIIVQIAGKLQNNEGIRARQKDPKVDPKKYEIPGLKDTVLPLAFQEYHLTAGYAVASRWSLTEIVADVVKNHHDYKKAQPAHQRLCAIVQLANLTCHHYGLGHAEEPCGIEKNEAWEFLNVTEDRASDLANQAQEVAHKLMGFM